MLHNKYFERAGVLVSEMVATDRAELYSKELSFSIYQQKMDTRWPKQLCVNIGINRNPSYRCHQTGWCVAGGGAPGAVQCG